MFLFCCDGCENLFLKSPKDLDWREAKVMMTILAFSIIKSLNLIFTNCDCVISGEVNELTSRDLVSARSSGTATFDRQSFRFEPWTMLFDPCSSIFWWFSQVSFVINDNVGFWLISNIHIEVEIFLGIFWGCGYILIFKKFWNSSSLSLPNIGN